jgi:hypothetical protein
MFSEEVQCIGILEVSRNLVRFVFNRTEGKLEVVVLKGIWIRYNEFQTPLLKFIRLQLGN